MEKVDDDTAYYRQRTVARLIDKRRQIESLEHKEAEERKAEDMKFRVQWKEGFKRKRSELISSKVDKRILHRIMREYPGIAQAVNAEKLGIVESKGDEVLADLADDFDEREIGAENPLMSPNIKVPGLLGARGSKPSQAVQFLQNSATFSLSVNHRLKEQHAAQLRSATGAPDWRGHAAEGPTDTTELRSTIRRASSATESDFGADDRAKVNSARGQDSSRLFSSYRSELQVSKLVLSLLQDNSNGRVPHTGQPEAISQHGINSEGKEGSIVDQFSNRPIKATGLMSKLFRDSTLHRDRNLTSSPTAHGTSFTLHRSSTPGAGRTLTSGSKRGGGDTVSGASGGGGSGGSVGSDELSSRAAAVAPELATSNNAMFCSLAEGVFLMGPSAHSIQEQIELRRDERTTPPGGSGASDAGLPSVPDFNAVVSPTVLFCTERGYSAEIFSLLPMYCFPSDTEMAVRSAKTATPNNGPSRRRKNSLNLLTSKTAADSVQEGLKGAKKRNAVFFNSDFALGLSAAKETAAGGKADTAAVGAAVDQNTLPAVNVGMMQRNPFVVLIGDHTSFEYGVCVQLPMTFKMDGGLTVTTSYVLCLMTKLPFFNLLFHVLEQFDAYFDGFRFREPIPVQDLSFPYMPELRPLSDLGAKLKRLLVPKYPYIISTALNNVTTTRRRASTELSALGFASSTAAAPVANTAAATGAVPAGQVVPGGMLTAEYPTLDNEQDMKAILPDVEFSYGAITSSRKVNAMFKRSVYQSYFSAAGTKFDSSNRALTELISRYDKMVADFVPNSVHRSEKDKEDTYLIMLWALPVLLKHLPLDQVVLALGCAISEMRIIVKHPDLHVVSAVILALLQLLRPLRWCAPVVVTMPDALDTMLESPTFVMIGLQKLPAHFTLLEGFVVIDPLERIVHLNPIDVVESHTILLPHGSKLVNALSTSAETILRCTKKKRNTRHRRSVPHGELEVAEAGQTGTGAPVPPTALPPPVELDVSSYENLQLLAAVKTFTGLVSNHIQAILNTAIQMQQQTKQASREERRLLIRTTSTMKIHKPSKPKPAVPLPPPAPAAPVSVSAPAAAAPAAPQLGEVPHPPTATMPVAALADGQLFAQGPSQVTAEVAPGTVTASSGAHQDSGTQGATSESPQRDPPKGNHSSSDAKRRRQTDCGPGLGLHSPSSTTGEGRHLPKKSPADRHSLPPSKKSPHHLGLHGGTHEQAEHREKGREKSSPLKQPDFRPAKAKDFAERMKHNHKPSTTTHTVHAGHGVHGGHGGPGGHGLAHPPHTARTPPRHSVGGAAAGKHGKDGTHHATRPVGKSKAATASGTVGAAKPPSQAVDSAAMANTDSPAAEGATAVPGEEGAVQKAAPEDADGAAQRTPLTLQASGRLMSGNALVFSIDALMSPFPVSAPSPKAKGSAKALPEEAVPLPAVENLVPTTTVRSGPEREEPTTRDSLNDETCSEITVTDAGGLHAGDDGSGGQRGRTESSHDSGDRAGSEAAVESIASSSSSLPSLRSNAPLLLVKEIGQSGTKFISRIHETQMYSNYCQLLRQQSALVAAKRAAAEKALQEGAARLLAATSTDQMDELGLTGLASPNVKAWSHMSLAAEVESAQLAGQGGDGDLETELELDALHEVFSVLLSGTTPMTEETRQALTTAFARRCSSTVEEVQAKLGLTAPPLEGGRDAIKSAFEAAVRKYTKLTNSTPASGDGDEGSGTALWCSGLRCGGLCNTPYCNSICLTLWVEKVRALRRQAAFRSILSKKNASSATLLSSARTLRHQLDDSAPDAQRASEKGAPAGGRAAAEKAITALLAADKAVEVIRHHKETQSQYEQRKSIVESKKLDLLRAARPATATQADQTLSKHLKQRSVYGPSNVDGKKHLYARGSSADPATLAIAKYYAERQRKYRKRQERRALKVLVPLMLRFVCLYRKYKFFNAIYLIQALIRGFYVRNHIPELVEALIARRIRRLLAVIRIRRYLRQHADQIYRRYLRAKMEVQRRRRATISIPVRVSGTMSEKAPSSRQQQPRIPRKVYSISDDILPSSGIIIPGLSGTGASAAGSGMDSAAGASGSASSNVPSSEKRAQAAVADSSTSGFDSPAAQQAAEEQGGGSGGTFVAGGENASGKGPAPKPQPRFSTGAYTERVKEYLQFGKILHRSASTSIEPNKYAAHYMQRRNSRGAPGSNGGPGVPAPPNGSPPKVASASASPVPTRPVAMIMPSAAEGDSPAPASIDLAQEAPVDPEVTEPATATGDGTGSVSRRPSGTAASMLFSAMEESATAGNGAGSGSGSGSGGGSTLSPDSIDDGALSPQSRSRPKVDLYISTRFSSDDSETSSSNSNALNAEAVHTTPIVGSAAAAQAGATVTDDVVVAPSAEGDEAEGAGGAGAGASTAADATERNDMPLLQPSPTSGIPMVHGTYEDSDEENAPQDADAEGSRQAKTSALMHSEGSSEAPGSPLSLLDMNVVHNTLRSSHNGSSGDLATGDARVIRPATARTAPSTLTADEDDRASVLSSNSNSTTPARRSSTAGSTTDFETAQPVLLSILSHHHSVARTSSASTIGVASDSADKPPREHDAASSVVGDDGTVISSVSQSSTRTGRSTLRSSLPPNFLHDASNFKKMSPIGRYAAEKSYDMARIFHPRHGGGVGTSRVPFQASGSVDGDGDKGAVLSPLQQHRTTDSLPSQAARPGRLGVLGESTRQMRRQTFFVPGSRRLGGQDLESIAESLSAASSAVNPAPGRGGTRSERLSGWESNDSIGAALETLPSEEQHYNWVGAEARRRTTLHSTLPTDSPTHRGSPSHQRTPSSSSLEETLRVKEASKAHSDDWVPRSEHLQYHLHSKTGSPKAQGSSRTHTDSPTRALLEGAEKEGRGAKAGEQMSSDLVSRASEYGRPDHRGRTMTADTLGLDGEDADDDDDELEFSAVDDLQLAVKHPPLRTLGCNVMEYMNRQQIRSLQEMYRLLRDGVEILKHGRRGAPKFKTLFCDANMTKLYWRAQGSRPDGNLDNLAEDASYYPTLLDPTAPAASLALGVDVTAATPSSGAPRLPFGGKSNADRVLYIRDIKEVREDCESEVMQRSVAKGYVTRGCTSTVSIVWEDRTLDFEIEEDAWKVLFHALQILVNFYQVLVAAPRATFSSGRPPEGFFNFLTYDTAGPGTAAAAANMAASSNSLSTSTSTAAAVTASAPPLEGRSAPKRRMSSGFGSMLLPRRSSSKMVVDSDTSAHL